MTVLLCGRNAAANGIELCPGEPLATARLSPARQSMRHADILTRTGQRYESLLRCRSADCSFPLIADHIADRKFSDSSIGTGTSIKLSYNSVDRSGIIRRFAFQKRTDASLQWPSLYDELIRMLIGVTNCDTFHPVRRDTVPEAARKFESATLKP